MKNLILIILILILTACGGGGDNATVTETETKEPLKIETYNLKLTHKASVNQPDFFVDYTALYEGENFYFVRFHWKIKPNVFGKEYGQVDAQNNTTKKFSINKLEIEGKIKISLMDFSGNVLNEREIFFNQ
jgi:hypothetical protein